MICTERNEARRVDRQLSGRCARQGDPGSVEAILSWDDGIMDFCAPRLIFNLGRRIHSQTSRFTYWVGLALTRMAQRTVERRHARARKGLLKQDQRLDDIFAFSGPME